MTFNYQAYINSDHSILIEFAGEINESLLRYILGAAQSIQQNPATAFVELVPAYNSLLVIFDPLRFSPESALENIKQRLSSVNPLDQQAGKLIEIPVCYDSRVAEDLEYVADYCKMTVEELIQAHTQQGYTVYMLGFLPGFLYLGDLDPKLYCPRRDNPRTRIEAGSVGIGGNQTGIYPINSPGGWQIIGRSPVAMLDVKKSPPSIANPLDKVRFVPISYQEFKKLSEASA